MNQRDIEGILRKHEDVLDVVVAELKPSPGRVITAACIVPRLARPSVESRIARGVDTSHPRRRESRFNCLIACTVHLPAPYQALSFHSEIWDISPGGACIAEIPYNLIEHDLVEVIFNLPAGGKSIQQQAIVRNSVSGRVGLQFVSSPGIRPVILPDLAAYAEETGATPPEQRRQSSRFALQRICTIETGTHQLFQANTVNVSTGGIALSGIPAELQAGIDVSLTFILDNGSLNLSGRTVWNSGSTAGIRFNEESSRFEEIIFQEEKNCYRKLHRQLQSYLEQALPPAEVPQQLFFTSMLPADRQGIEELQAQMSAKCALLQEEVLPLFLADDQQQLYEIWEELMSLTAGDRDFNAKLLDQIPQPVLERFPILQLLHKSSPEKKIYFGLSHPQQRIWYAEKIAPRSCLGNLFHSCRLPVKIDFIMLERVFNWLVKHCEFLRLGIREIAGTPQQFINPYTPFAIEYFNFSSKSKHMLFSDWVHLRITTPLLRADDPLYYFAGITFPDGQDGFFFGIHHTIADETSIAVIIELIKNRYKKMLGGLTDHEPAGQWQAINLYPRYISEEQNYEKSPQFLADEEFWLTHLAGYTEPAYLKYGSEMCHVEARRRTYPLPQKLQAAITLCCEREITSVFRIFLAVLYIYLNRITEKEDLVIGCTFHNRFSESFKTSLGMFVSTVPFRLNPDETELNFRTLLQYIKQEIHGIKEHQHYPYEVLTGKLEKQGIPLPLFDVMLNYHNMPFCLPTTWHFQQSSPFPLVINIAHRGEQGNLIMEIDHHTRLFADWEIDQLARHLLNLLDDALAKPASALPELKMLSLGELQQILCTFDNTRVEYPTHQTISKLFEIQAERTPDNIAVFFEGRSLSYAQLNVKANQLAWRLRQIGVYPDQCIGILVCHSLEMIIAVLAVLKAGAAYLPLDPAYPADRIRYSLEDSDAKILITQQHLSDKAGDFSGLTIELDNPNLFTGSSENLPSINNANDLAYIIYTSGSTGKPKGVMIEHRSLVNFCFWNNRVYQVTEHDRSTKYASFGFDASVWEIFPYLICGAAVYILDEQKRYDMEYIYKYFCEQQITMSFLPTQICEEYLKLDKSCNSLRHLMTGGDKLRHFRKGRFTLWNNYGPTEATIISTNGIIEKESGNIPIGKPIDNCTVYIINKQNRLQPVGIAGELCIAGSNLARGYLKQPELTAEKFTENPFLPGTKMYRTGDLARWLPDGNIEFLGRIDFQVKLRGYRIELGEIEAVIKKQTGVADAFVLLKELTRDDKQLAAYILPETGQAFSPKRLQESIKQELPPYMVPTLYAGLSAIPINNNGKLDRRVLAALEVLSVAEENYEAAQTAIEQQVSVIWQELLKVKTIGVNHNFFEAGGNSLKLIALSSLLQDKFHIEIPVLKLFEYTTIRKQAELISGQHQESHVISTYSPGEEVEWQSRSIAVIGLAGRFPGAADIDEFWDNLLHARESITFFSDEELLAAGVSPQRLSDPAYVKAKGILDGVEYFDADFFGYTAQDALHMDPQVRIFHEVVYQALEQAGYVPQVYKDKIGLFAGAADNFFWLTRQLHGFNDFCDRFPFMILNKDFIATRIAYKLNLCGPAETVQTACSTSLVAVDMAVHALLADDCELALAGGVCLFLPQPQGYLYREGFTLSPDGHCRAFDSGAAGMVPGEGAGVVVLKRLDKALKDHDTIWAVIRGSAINNDGSEKIGYTAPSVTGQAEVIKKAIARAGVLPETITYIEAHGTGTSLGDPVEIAGLQAAFNTSRKQYCRIGSVKTNIGHLDTAAGIAGLIKTVLALHYRQLPPSLHFQSPNPKINFEDSPFLVNHQLIGWEGDAGVPLRAGVSSFGIGGTNAHVILEEAPSAAGQEMDLTEDICYVLLPISAKTESALEVVTTRLCEYLQDNPQIPLADIAYTLQRGREAFEFRKVIICKNAQEAINTLNSGQLERNVIIKRIDNKPEERKTMQITVSVILEKLERQKAATWTELAELGRLWCAGMEIDWQVLHWGRDRCRIPLPVYPFEKRKYIIDENLQLVNGLDDMHPVIADPAIKPEKKNDLGQWFYIPQWTNTPLVEIPDSDPQCFLIFLDYFGIGEQVARMLSARRHQVLTIDMAATYQKINQSRYLINPTSDDDYVKLFTDLARLKIAVNRIIHLFPLTIKYTLSGKNINEALATGYTSLLNIVRNFSLPQLDGSLALFNVSNNLFDVYQSKNLNLNSSTLMGAVKTIPLEYTNICCTNIDIELPGSILKLDKFIRQIVFEVLSDCRNQVVAYRNNYRWIQEFKPVICNTPAPVKNRIRNKGVYLITGGLGGMGFTIARELLEKYQARLILVTGRDSLPPAVEWDRILQAAAENTKELDKIRKLRELQQFDSEILHMHADLSNPDQFTAVIRAGIKHYKHINGIIHTAGLADGKIIRYRNKKSDTRVLMPKVACILALENLSEDLQLDFLVLCSSLTSITGTYGQAGYCAANAFLDAYSYYTRNKWKHDVVTINWDAWQQVGMASKLQEIFRIRLRKNPEAMGKELITAYLEHSLTPAEGMQVFYKALELDLPQIAISTIDLSNPVIMRLNKELLTLLEPGKQTKSLEMLAVPAAGMTQAEITGILIQMWIDAFGNSRIDVTDDFFMLGGDSLLAIQMVAKLNARFPLNLKLHTFLDLPTINQLSKQIIAILNPGCSESQTGLQNIPQVQTIKQGTEETLPLFLIHPVSGTVFFYRELAQQLPVAQMVYGIEARGLDGQQAPLTKIEEMASDYIKLIRRVQPAGPYLLGGSSLGGCIAYEMAAQLTEQNLFVGSIIMLDTPGPASRLPCFKNDAEILAYFLSYNDLNYTETLTHLIPLSENERLKFFLSKNSLYNQMLFDDNDLENLKTSIRLTLINSQAMDRYYAQSPRVYKGKTLFFSATESSQIPINLEQDWQGYLPGETVVHKVTGNHISMNLAPNVQHIARYLGRYLKQLNDNFTVSDFLKNRN